MYQALHDLRNLLFKDTDFPCLLYSSARITHSCYTLHLSYCLDANPCCALGLPSSTFIPYPTSTTHESSILRFLPHRCIAQLPARKILSHFRLNIFRPTLCLYSDRVRRLSLPTLLLTRRLSNLLALYHLSTLSFERIAHSPIPSESTIWYHHATAGIGTERTKSKWARSAQRFRERW